jgi:hypothetical protein
MLYELEKQEYQQYRKQCLMLLNLEEIAQLVTNMVNMLAAQHLSFFVTYDL